LCVELDGCCVQSRSPGARSAANFGRDGWLIAVGAKIKCCKQLKVGAVSVPQLSKRIFTDSQFARYLLVGGINTSLVYCVYALGVYLGAAYPVALAIALVFGIVIGFNAQGRFVFSERSTATFFRYLASWLVMYAINVAIIALLRHFGVDPYLAGALAVPVMAVLSFVVLRLLVFRNDQKNEVISP
jgi:putative flippase GtrA